MSPMLPWLAAALLLGPAQERDEPTEVPPSSEEQTDPANPQDPSRSSQILAGWTAKLRELATQHPQRIRLETLGWSRGGRELWLLTLTDFESGEPGGKPAVLVLPSFSSGLEAREAGELLVACSRRLVEQSSSEERFSRALERTTLLFIPSPDPDGLERVPGDLPKSAQAALDAALDPIVELERNFPVGWHPWRNGGGGGPYPLSEPEARCLAELLLARANLAAIHVFSRARSSLAAELLDSGERTVYGSLATELPASVRPVFSVAATDAGLAPDGRLAAFAQVRLGVFSVASLIAPESEGMDVEKIDAALADILALVERLPELVVSEPLVRSLRSGLWQVDFSVRNGGILPTGPLKQHCACDQLDVRGARPLAAALRAQGGQEFKTLAPPRGVEAAEGSSSASFDLPILRGNEGIDVRLVLAGEEGAQLELDLRAVRSSGTRVRLTLQ